ncbi:MAG TPA: DEAD/DEAH box helicase [Polyangiales bacterium]
MAITAAASLASFEHLGLGVHTLAAVRAAGYQQPTAVQAAAIPAVLAGRDVRARAQTGSGKTAAFGLPLLQRLCDARAAQAVGARRGNAVSTLVLAPTRELVAQISEVLAGFCQQLPVRIRGLAVYGGVSINPQMMALRGGVDVLVATPGRLLDLHRQNALHFDQLRALVLDEADRMVSLGFRDELTEILALLPAQRQNLLFSATFPEELTQLTQPLLHEPVEIDVVGDAEPRIEQHVYTVPAERKAAALIHLIKQNELRQVLVFVSAKKTGDKLGEKLNQADIRAAVFHGDKSQQKRSSGLAEFRTGKLRVLIATDLAARGIDIEELPAVVNFELPARPTTTSIASVGPGAQARVAWRFR